MVGIGTFFSALVLAVPLVAGQASNDDPRGKVLYVNYPSCDHYRCEVVWRQAESVYVNWLNAPKGGLRIQLAPADASTGLKTYTVTDYVGSIHGYSGKKCNDMGTAEKCGRFDWTVPRNIAPGKYQIEVSSLAKPSIVGYTDTVVVKKIKTKRHDTNRLD